MNRKSGYRSGAALIALSVALSGCVSGPTGATRPTAAPNIMPPAGPTATPGEFQTAEYNRSWGLDAINAAQVYAEGYTGEGVIIGFVDFNFDFNSPDLDIHPASRTRVQANVDLYEDWVGEEATLSPHGTAVAVVAAGLKDELDTHGVAFDAQVLLVDFFSGVYSYDVVENGVTYHVSDPYTYMLDQGVRVINESLGYDEDDIVENPGDTDGDGIRDVNEAYTIDWSLNMVLGGGLMVASAGNNGDPEPSLSNLDNIDQMRQFGVLHSGDGAFIIVGAVDENLELAGFSDAAGNDPDVMSRYMVAPGVDIIAPWDTASDGPGLYFLSGTSFSAPHVAGAAAIIFQRWPSLTAREVADILFDSATDLGAPGIDNIYGQGLLNLDSAMQPIGQSNLAVPSGTAATPVAGAGITLGTAFGDAAGFRAGISDVMMLDGYGRDFQVDLGAQVLSRPTRAAMIDVMTSHRDWQATSLALGTLGTFGLAVGEDPWEAENLALMGNAAASLGRDQTIVTEFAGSVIGMDWVGGSGRNLAEAMTGDSLTPYGDDLLSLTGADRHAMRIGRGAYAFGRVALTRDWDLSFGASIGEEEGLETLPLAALSEDAQVRTSAIKLDRYGMTSRLGIEVGHMQEEGAILGSRSVGGLALTDRSRTIWTTLRAEQRLSPKISAGIRATFAVTDPGTVQDSLFQSLTTIRSSSFTASLTARDTFRKGDRVALHVYQPLRVERAGLTLTSGVALDPVTGAVLFRDRQLSLTPSGREISVEAAYRLTLGSWELSANLAWRHDADHVAGRQDAMALIGVDYRF